MNMREYLELLHRMNQESTCHPAGANPDYQIEHPEQPKPNASPSDKV